jgi:hypothetical protein
MVSTLFVQVEGLPEIKGTVRVTEFYENVVFSAAREAVATVAAPNGGSGNTDVEKQTKGDCQTGADDSDSTCVLNGIQFG